MTKRYAVFGCYRPRNGKPRFEGGRRAFRRFLGIHVQLPVREAESHAGERIGDKAQAGQTAELFAPVVRHIAVHGIQEEGIRVARQYRFYVTRTGFCRLKIPLRGDPGMGHDQFFILVDLQQGLTAQPVNQIVRVWRFQQRSEAIFRLVAADPGKHGQQMEIVIAQHHAHAIAQRFDET